MKGGNFYGAEVDPQIGSAGLAHPAVANAGANSATGQIVPEMYGGRRRRRGKKVTRKTRKTRGRRRTMRGGASYVGSANVGHSFAGAGVAGLANHGGYAANVNGAGGPTQGGNGVYTI